MPNDIIKLNKLTPNKLGAGTALPSIAFARRWLSQNPQHPEASSKLQLCLADYNRSVLELATLPNLYLALSSHNNNPSPATTETDISPATLDSFSRDLSSLNINISAISGSWTPQFVDLVAPMLQPRPGVPHETIVLASETIYSPDSIRAFAETLVGVLGRAQEGGGRARGLVAAKRVYFGVGGGMEEFLRVLRGLGGEGAVVWETGGGGVRRIIVEVTVPDGPRE